jgi:hypothetical protein
VPTFGYMKRSVLLSSLLLLAVTAAGCVEPSSSDAETEDDEVNAASLKVYLKIAESKIVYTSHTESFGVRGTNLDLGCRTRAWYMSSKPSLYDNGWSVAKAGDFSEDHPDADLKEYILATCRDADTQIIGWFGKHREYEFTVPEQLLDDDYKASRLPLILQQSKLDGSGTPQYYTCNGAFSKKLLGETANAKHYDIEVKCKKREAPRRASSVRSTSSRSLARTRTSPRTKRGCFRRSRRRSRISTRRATRCSRRSTSGRTRAR